MIPKKIHYTWFSNDPFPDSIKECMNSWKAKMPDYEFVKWDREKIKGINSIFLNEALSCKKWAFAADFVRLWALYNEGGIYLDTDVLCYKSFDVLLDSSCFIGKENSFHINGRNTEQYLTSHCMGAEKGHPIIKECLNYYDNRHFITSENSSLPPTLRMDMTLLPYIQSEIFKQFGYNSYPSATNIQSLQNNTKVYPPQYFDCAEKSRDSFCKHLAAGSWRESRTSDAKITFAYKVGWRIRYVADKVADKFGYILTKKL